MKKRILLSAFLVFSQLATGTALAQTTTEEPAPVIEQTQPIEDQDTVFDMIGSGWNTAMDGITDSWNGMTDTIVGGWNSMVNAIVDTTTGGWNAVVDTVTGGKDAVTGTLSEWQASVESYMQEKNWTEDVKNAWNTLKQGAADAGSVTKEQAESAYYTVRNWFAQTGETIDQGYAAVIDKMASEAGVAEATVSDWFRTVDSYINDSVNQASESVLEAWNIVKQGTLDLNSEARDQLESAEKIIRDWFQTQGVANDSDVAEAFDGIVGQEK